jgi:hypothetical protein
MRENTLTACRQSVCKIGGAAGSVKLKFALFSSFPAIVCMVWQTVKALWHFINNLQRKRRFILLRQTVAAGVEQGTAPGARR